MISVNQKLHNNLTPPCRGIPLVKRSQNMIKYKKYSMYNSAMPSGRRKEYRKRSIEKSAEVALAAVDKGKKGIHNHDYQ